MSDYWLKKAKKRVIQAEQIGLDAVILMLLLYEETLESINRKIISFYAKNSNSSGLVFEEISSLLGGVEKEKFVKGIQSKTREVGLNVYDVYDPARINRLTRLEALREEVFWETMAIVPILIRYQREAYEKVIKKSYLTGRKDIAKYLGKSVPQMSTNDRIIKTLLRENWQGGNFYSRTWANNSVLSARVQNALPKIVSKGLISGASQEKMQRQIREEFDISKNAAERLVRTETNYFQNQAELQGYKDEGIEEYRYEAVMDNRTSEICTELNGQVFEVSKAQAGENYPPMHPNCRSTTVVILPNELVKE